MRHFPPFSAGSTIVLSGEIWRRRGLFYLHEGKKSRLHKLKKVTKCSVFVGMFEPHRGQKRY